MTLIFFWVLSVLFIIDLLNLSLYIERLYITRHQKWSPVQSRQCSTSLAIQCATVLYCASYLGLFAYALFSADSCPYQGRFADAVRACRWLLINVFWFGAVLQITDHVLERDGTPARRPPRAYAHPSSSRTSACCGRLIFQVRGGLLRLFIWKEARLNLPGVVCLSAGAVAFALEASHVLGKPPDYFKDRCDEYLAATTASARYKTDFCKDLRSSEGTYGLFEVIVVLCFFLLFIFYTLLSRFRLRQLPWISHRSINISLRVLLVQTCLPLCVMLVSKICFVFLNTSTSTNEGCGTKFATTNSPELSIIISIWSAVRLYCTSPIMLGEYRDQIRQRTVQHFLWLEPGERVVTTEVRVTTIVARGGGKKENTNADD